MIFVSICRQDCLEFCCVGNVSHRNVPNNLECLEHLLKFDEIKELKLITTRVLIPFNFIIDLLAV